MLCGFCNFKFVGAKLVRFLDNISIFLLFCGRIESNYLMKIKIAAETSNSFEIDSENKVPKIILLSFLKYHDLILHNPVLSVNNTSKSCALGIACHRVWI